MILDMYIVNFTIHNIDRSTDLTPAEALEASWLDADAYLFYSSENNSIITNAVVFSGSVIDDTYYYKMLVQADDNVDNSEHVKNDVSNWLQHSVGLDIYDFEIINIQYQHWNKFEEFTDEADIFKEL